MRSPSRDSENSKLPQLAKNMTKTFLSASFFEAVPDAMVAVDAQGEIVQVNSQTERLFGYTQGELIGQKVEMLVPESLRGEHHHHRDRFHEKPQTRRMGAALDLRGRRKDGSEFPVEISLSPVHTDSGLVVLSAIRDITDRKRIEEELRKAHVELRASKDRELSEQRSRMALIVDSSQDAIIAKDQDGIITNWNKGAEQVYGYTAEEAIGKPITILAPEERRDETMTILARIRTGERVEPFETVRVRKDGQRLSVSLSVSPIQSANGDIVGASIIARDVTGQRRAEDMLRQAQKMEAVGRLAGGVSHDFNNILGIVTACCELMRARVSDSSVGQYLDNIQEASKRGSSLTRQLLAFSRRQMTLQPRLLDLNDSLRELAKLLRPLMGDDVQIIQRHGTNHAIIEADPSQLDQVVLNIAVNARDAMPRGGKLILETSIQDFDAALAEQHPPLKPGRYVVLAISDTGIGMDAVTMSKIFDPFFTTKEVGRGTGLGLATVYGIVKHAGGHVLVYSEPNRGTTFKVYFPAADHKLDSAQQSEVQILPPRAQGRTVLLVEDDNLMRSVTKQMLEDHGYKVLEAEDGKSALEHLRANGAVDVTLTDVVMRGMSGPELAVKIVNSHPSIKVIYMSGYTGELLDETEGMKLGIPLLEKPFTRAALLKALHALVG